MISKDKNQAHNGTEYLPKGTKWNRMINIDKKKAQNGTEQAKNSDQKAQNGTE